MTVRFYINEAKPHAKSAAGRLSAAARRAGLGVMKGEGAADVVIALGGDGTMLRAVHEFPWTPVVGFNLGSLGYLASVEERDFAKALKCLARGRYRVSERSMLEIGSFTALNEIVITRELTGHAAVLEVAADGKRSTRYTADGLVVATPTGSTAYSLSAGGPLLMPDTASFVVTPLNPHALGVRPVVVRDDVTLTVVSRRRVNDAAERLGVYADGEQAFMLDADKPVEIRKAERSALIVELEGYDPYAVMAKKLGWGRHG